MLKKKEQIALFDKILRLTRAGLQHKDIATLLKRHGTNKEQKVANNCLEAIKKGVGFSSGLKQSISSNAFLTLTGGEHVGSFEQGIEDALKSLKLSESSSTEIAKVLFKPVMGLIVMFCVSALLAAYAYPMLAEQAPRQTWGSISVTSEMFGLFWLHHGWAIGSILLILTPIMVVSLSRFTGQGRLVIDNIPIFRQYRFIQCTNFLTTLSYQISVGTGLKEALTHYKANSTPYMISHLNQMLFLLKTGRTNLGDILNSGLLDPQEHDTLKMLSDTGEAADILKKSASIHSEQLQIEIYRLKVWGSRCLYTGLATVGVWMVLGIGSLAFKIATSISF